VIVGNIFMKSGHNGSVNPAVDTVATGGSVTWTARGVFNLRGVHRFGPLEARLGASRQAQRHPARM